jgi:hypothetical protein
MLQTMSASLNDVQGLRYARRVLLSLFAYGLFAVRLRWSAQKCSSPVLGWTRTSMRLAGLWIGYMRPSALRDGR